jgi:hypothetical protein
VLNGLGRIVVEELAVLGQDKAALSLSKRRIPKVFYGVELLPNS